MSGTFVYDATTNIYSSLAITTFGPNGASSYLVDSSTVGASQLFATSAANITGHYNFVDLQFAGPLTNAGGIVALLTTSSEQLCYTGPLCTAPVLFRSIRTGTVQAPLQSVPEPGTLGLLGAGLLGLALRRQKAV